MTRHSVHSYSLQLLIDAWRQHDAGHDGPQQQDEGVDDPGHRGVPDARTAAAHQTRCTAAETWHLEGGGGHRVTLVSCQSEDEIVSDVSAAVVTSITETTTAADVTS